ncbi:hypothetical protein MBRA_02609 [Methylobacterium brachiatum]|nr:hypothetical protein MBRA_02609 [Methylobacterium brachiatum]
MPRLPIVVAREFAGVQALIKGAFSAETHPRAALGHHAVGEEDRACGLQGSYSPVKHMRIASVILVFEDRKRLFMHPGSLSEIA